MSLSSQDARQKTREARANADRILRIVLLLVFANIIKLAEFVQEAQQALALIAVQFQLAGHGTLGFGQAAADVHGDESTGPGEFADSPEQLVKGHRALVPVGAEL